MLDTLVLMPPLSTTPAELDHALAALDFTFLDNLGIDSGPASA